MANNITDKNIMGIGIAVGVGIGIVYGVVTDDLAQCTGLGASFGIFIGAFWLKKFPPSNDES